MVGGFLMAIIICPDCGKEQDNLNKFCRNCGADLSKVKIDLGIDEDSTDPVVEGEFSQKSIDVPIQNKNGNNSNELIVLESDENNHDAEISSDSIESGTESVQEESRESNVNKCSNCGTELNYGEKFCPNCGQSTDTAKENYPKNFCPNCGGKISESLKFCPNCGFDLNNISNNNANSNQRTGQNLPTRKEPIVSVILSFVFPGLGQFYNGQPTKGIYFIIMAIVSAVLMVILIGVLLYILVWLWSIIDAYNSAEKFNKGEFVEDKLF